MTYRIRRSRVCLALTLATGAVALSLTAAPALAQPLREGSFNTDADSGPTWTGNPGDLVGDATSSQGAVVSWTDPTATDPDGLGADGHGDDRVSCNPSAGGTFGFGATTVTCSATDDAHVTTTTSFTVTVPLVIETPDLAPIAATGPSGASVDYDVTTEDLTDGSNSDLDTPQCGPASGTTFPIGQTLVTCTAADSQSNSASASFEVDVVDMSPPVITVPSDISTNANTLGGATVGYSATASDLVDGSDPVDCGPASGSVFPVGKTTVTCNASDSQGLVAQPASFTVKVTDTSPPVIASSSNISTQANALGGAVVTYSDPIATDLVDGTDPVTCAPDSGSTFAVGTTTVDCNATDKEGLKAAQTSFTVKVTDGSPPVINGTPSNMTEAATGPNGALVTYTNPTATDLVDGTDSVTCTPDSGSTFALGATTVDCNATDKEELKAQQTSFTITVKDESPPVISQNATVITPATLPGGGAKVSYPTPAVTDLVDGSSDTAVCSPLSGTTFVLGQTAVTCNVTDSQGLAATPMTFDVDVLDSADPVIEDTPANITAQATGPSGAVVSYVMPTVADLVDGSSDTAVCSPVSGSTFAIGTTTVECNATDKAKNQAAPTSFTVTVVDHTPPVIHGTPADMAIAATSSKGATVSYTTPTATDIVDGTDSVACAPGSGSLFPAGSTTVTCTAKDKNGNSASTTFQVVVNAIPAFTADPGTVKHAEAGTAAVAVKYVVPTATDPVDGKLKVTCTPKTGAKFRFGQTTVTCSATSSTRTTTSTSFVVEVTDKLAPPPISRLNARATSHSLLIRWAVPGSADVSEVVLTRRPGLNGAASSVIYRGRGSSFVDSQVKVGVHYMYSVVTVSSDARRSAKVRTSAALPLPPLYAPADGSALSLAPLLRWLPSRRATYYNVQLWFNGKEILSAWPRTPKLRLHRSWSYGGARHTLVPGTYQWYVWPGLGPISAARYGHQLGEAQFTVS